MSTFIVRNVMMQRSQRNPRAAIVGGVLAEREPAIQLDVVNGGKPAVLIGYTAGAFFKFLSIFRRPPIAQISLRIIFASLIVKTVRELVTDDHSNAAKVSCIVGFFVEKRRLQDSR